MGRPYTTPKKKLDWRAHLTDEEAQRLADLDAEIASASGLAFQRQSERTRLINAVVERARKAEEKP